MAEGSGWDPDTYPTEIRSDIADYDLLQAMVVKATGMGATQILELGIGAGETAAGLLAAHPSAHLVGIDSSPEMLKGAAARLPADQVALREQDLGDPLPPGPFDLVASALAIHHLQGDRKPELFRRVAAVLMPEGTFVFGDVVVPLDPADGLIENEPGYDFPSTVDEQLALLVAAGLEGSVFWSRRDLAVIVARRAT